MLIKRLSNQCARNRIELSSKNLLNKRLSRYALAVAGLLGVLSYAPAALTAPGDHDDDGIADILDIDDDNDGITDLAEELLIPILTNPSFETFDPAVATTTFSPGYITGYMFNEQDVPGWDTTAPDGQIEIWESTFLNVPAQAGDAFMEINANQSALLFQTLTTEGGDIIDWSVWHRGRNGIDTARVMIGGTVATLSPQAVPLASGTTAWINYTGSYLVPAGQTTTIIGFESTQSGGNGNFIDNLVVTRTADTDLDSNENHIDLDSDNDGISDLVESGAAAANIAADTDYNGTVSLAEAEAILGAGLADVDADGLMDIFDLDLNSKGDTQSIGTVPIDSDSNIADYKDQDSDGDGIPDTVEARATAGYVANDGDVTDQDLDSDGVIDLFDANDASTGEFAGSFIVPVDTDSDNIPDYLDDDSDGDLLLDANEIATPIVNSFPDPDGAVTTTLASLQNIDTDTSDVDFRSVNDADADGVPDHIDPNDLDVCNPNFGGIPTTKDCDGDGNPVATDSDDSAPNAANDSGDAGTAINILANDDFLPNNDPTNLGTTSITGVASGTTCLGTSAIDVLTGSLTYTPAATETSGTCDIVYEVCSTASTPGATPICETATVEINLADADGDGIPDALDAAPNDACIPSFTGTPTTKDCDGDGNPASTDTDSSAPNAADDAGTPGTPVDILSNDDFLPNNDPANLGTTSITGIPTGTTCLGTSAFDAVTGSVTYTPAASETSGSCDIAYEVCSTNGASVVCETAIVSMTLADTDGDGVPDSLDTAPNDACIPSFSGTPTTKDCDGDGNPVATDTDPSAPNATDDAGTPGTPVDILANDDFLPNNDPDNVGITSITGIAAGTTCLGTSAFDALTGSVTYTPAAGETAGSCALVYEVCNTSAATTVCETATVTMALTDSDGDGIPDALDTAPADACVPNLGGIPTTKDCDNDGSPASIDANPGTPTATDDTGAAGVAIDILANDDFLTNNDPDNLGDTTITPITTGSTCTGSPVFDDDKGTLVYTAAATETSGSCDIVYEVCNTTAGGTPVCETATVTITLNDSDGDGIPDSLDSDPADACIPNVTGTPSNKDCDGDGNPVATDNDPAAPNAANDSGTPSTVIDILGNDDYLPNSDPDNLGITTITPVAAGSTCTGTPTYDAQAGSLTYAAASNETTGTCDLVYQVCSASPTSITVCETAVVTIQLSDSDGDGIPDSLDTDPADACVPNMGGLPTTKDCDGDGNPVSGDPSPAAPEATDDTGSAGAPIDLLANDDYLPNSDPANLGVTTLTGPQAGSTCAGTSAFNAQSGTVIYTPAANEVSGSCVLVYEVCNTAPGGAPVCSTAQANIALLDTDGDGVPDSLDTAPNDACIPNMTGTPATKDCDGDGNPVSADPDPATPDASHDSGVPGQPIDILGNDNFLPNSDPAVLGITSITQSGGTCNGSISLNANTGMALYTAVAVDSGTNCVVEYEVCSTAEGATPVCDTANITITNPAPLTDSDGDGIPDAIDIDDDNDGIPDDVEGSTDTDGDGIPNHLDLDSDNDGLTDANEAGGIDVNGDGIIDGFTDLDGDGLDDATAAAPLPVPDTDADSTPDYLDIDSDDDGIDDLVEAGGTDTDGNGTVDNPTDANTDGLDDATATTPLPDPDTDGDGFVDHLELDSDDDGIPDATEGTVDTDNDGIPDYLAPPVTTGTTPGTTPVTPSTDDDGDGISNAIEGTGDTDGDGIPDYLDIDADNDGILDSTEFTEDTDADGVPDYLDLDSDNDGLTDNLEAGGIDADNDGVVDGFTDADGDGWADSVAASPLAEPDTDGEGIVDYLDLDSDNDGLPDVFEALGPTADTNNDGKLDNPIDGNTKGLLAGVIFNALQDSDGDLIPDHLDLDRDNDGTFDLVEAGGSDIDGNGQVDTWQDDDQDGIPNLADVDITGGVDSDNDGIDDSVDASILSDGDTDGDGIADRFDSDLQGNGFAPITRQLAPAGIIHIGLDGSGCSISTLSSNKGVDPMLPGLAVLSLFWLGLRRRPSRGTKSSNHKAHGLATVSAASLALAACSPYGKYPELTVPDDIIESTPIIQDQYLSDNDNGKFDRHVYAGVGIGASRLEPDTSEVPNVDVNDRVNKGGQVTIGADITKHFSLELHSADLGSAGLSNSGRINYHMHGGSALLYAGKARHAHARTGLTGFGRIGYGMLDDSPVGQVNYVEDNGNHVLFGAGLEYATRLGVAMRAEVISFDKDVQYGQVGILYRLGGKEDRPVQIVEASAPEPIYIPALVQPVPVEVVQAYDPCEQFDGVLEGVNFHSDSAQLTGSAELILDSVATNLAQCANAPVSISAHTDSQGSDQYNQALSQKRAVAVAKFLADRGIPTSRMTARAFGETRPIQSNNTAEGRAQNRRVELIAQ